MNPDGHDRNVRDDLRYPRSRVRFALTGDVYTVVDRIHAPGTRMRRPFFNVRKYVLRWVLPRPHLRVAFAILCRTTIFYLRTCLHGTDAAQ
jgi:hypothetical protein